MRTPFALMILMCLQCACSSDSSEDGGIHDAGSTTDASEDADVDASSEADIGSMDQEVGQDALSQPDAVVGDASGIDATTPDSGWECGYQFPAKFEMMSPRSLALDSANQPHIVYGGRDLNHAWRTSNGWEHEVISAQNCYVGIYASVNIDSNDTIRIAYIDYLPPVGLKVATNATGQWEVQHVDSEIGGQESYTEIGVGTSGNVHIAYHYDSVNHLKYATNVSGVWEIQTVSTQQDPGWYPSINLDATDRPHITHWARNTEEILYTTPTSSGWESDIVSSMPCGLHNHRHGSHGSTIFDSNGVAHLSYHSCVTNHGLEYASGSTNAWSIESVDTEIGTGKWTSISVDSNDAAHISYGRFVSSPFTLKYATNASGAWITETASDQLGGMYTSIAVDGSGVVHISSFDNANGQLVYSRKEGGIWTSEIVDSN